MALDSLRAAIWPPSDVPLDRAGRRLHRWRNRLVCVKLHYRRRDWWFRPSMAADRRLIFLRHGNMENCRSCRWKSHSHPDGKRHAFSHRSANSFSPASQSGQFTHIPMTPNSFFDPIKMPHCISLYFLILYK